jgi:PIN domain nuclease of toxin-antitoxin system
MKTYVLDASALFAFLQRKGDALKVNELVKEAIRGRSQVLCTARFSAKMGRNKPEWPWMWLLLYRLKC